MNEENIYKSLRIIAGVGLVIFGLNYFFQFFGMGEMSEKAGALVGALMAAGYLLPFLKIMEIIIGIMLITGKWVPLATVMLVPLTINFMLFHIFLAPSGILFAAIYFLLNIYLVWINWELIEPLFS